MSNTGLDSYWTLVDVDLTDIESKEPGDTREAITLTFHPSDLVDQPEGMLPAQATELAMAIMDAAAAWQSQGAGAKLLPEWATQ